MAVTVLTGENSFMLQQRLRQLVDTFVEEHTGIALEQLDGEEVEFDRIRESLHSLPFLASKKMVVLRAPSANKLFVESAGELLTELPDSIDVIIVEPKLDKRQSYYKFLKKQKGFHEFSQLDSLGLTQWLTQQATDQGGTLERQDAMYLIERVGANQQLLSNELLKLLSYDECITRETIDLLTERTPQSTIFELIDASLSGNTKKALDLYREQRALRVEPQQIIALLGWQLHIMALVKSAGQRSSSDIAKEAKLNPYVVQKTQAIVKDMPLAAIKKLIHDVLAIDIRVKSQPIDADEALQNLIISL